MGLQTLQQCSVECCLSTAPWTNVAILCQGGECRNGADGPPSYRFRENQRQSLQRANARGALGILVSLPLQPHTHGLGGHTHGLGGGACRDRDGCTCRGSLCPAGAGPRKPTLPDWKKVRNFNKNDGARRVASLPAQPYPELHTGAGSSRRLRGPPPLSWGHFLIPFHAPHTQHPSLPHHSKHLHVLMCFSHAHNPHTLFSIITHPLPPPHNTTPTAPNLHPPT